MKKILTVLLFSGAAAWLAAQTTVTAASFPAAGDTLKTATDLAPVGIVITAAGGPFDWDYSSLSQSSVKQETVYRPASEGAAFADFSNAELFADLGGGAETYYNVTPTSFDNLGFNGPDPAGIGITTLFKFTTPVPLRHAPLTFPAFFPSSSDVLVPFSTDAIPQEILDSLNIGAFVDSIRVRVTTERDDIVDAFGTLTIPGGSYEVLREKRIEYRETRVDVLIPFLGWQDVTDLIAGGFAGLGADTILTYNFFSNDAKEPIAIVTMDDAGTSPVQVQFKDNGIVSGSPAELAPAQALVRLSPNPAAGQVVFDLQHLAPGQYTLRLLDARGTTVLVKQLAAGRNEAVSLEGLAEGSYFYQVTDGKNKVQSTGKLLKINQ